MIIEVLKPSAAMRKDTVQKDTSFSKTERLFLRLIKSIRRISLIEDREGKGKRRA